MSHPLLQLIVKRQQYKREGRNKPESNHRMRYFELVTKPILWGVGVMILCMGLVGCENVEKLKTVQKIAIVSVDFDRRVIQYGPNLRVTNIEPIIQPEENADIEEIALHKKQFIKDWTASLVKVLSKYVEVRTPYNFPNETIYNELPVDTTWYLHSEPPFRPIKVAQGDPKIRQLCESLNVDAVLAIQIQLMMNNKQIHFDEREKDPFHQKNIVDDNMVENNIINDLYWENRVLPIQPTMFRLSVNWRLIGRDGDVILDREISADTNAMEYDVNYSDIVEFNWHDSQVMTQLKAQLFEKIDALFKSAKKSLRHDNIP